MCVCVGGGGGGGTNVYNLDVQVLFTSYAGASLAKISLLVCNLSY